MGTSWETIHAVVLVVAKTKKVKKVVGTVDAVADILMIMRMEMQNIHSISVQSRLVKSMLSWEILKIQRSWTKI